MADFDTTEFRAARFARSATERIENRSFPVVMRGYDRAAVDTFVQEMLELVRELEGRQSQESVVQRAIEEVGEETASILQRAHETADEIRQLADDVLATAEDALVRVSMPQMLTDPETEEGGPPTEEADPPAGEVELDVLPGGAAGEDDETEDER